MTSKGFGWKIRAITLFANDFLPTKELVWSYWGLCMDLSGCEGLYEDEPFWGEALPLRLRAASSAINEVSKEYLRTVHTRA